jgi:methionyl-tRNA formyltransferase
MKILWLGGDHPRHLYFINQIAKRFGLAGAIIEPREHMIPTPPEGTSENDKSLLIRHFDNRAAAEEHYFGAQNLPDCPTLMVTTETLNSEKSAEFVRSIDPDVVMIFGCNLIKGPLREAIPQQSINLHLGLSPHYRGAATLFWPFYFMEPAYAGGTFHYIIAEPDAGDIVHQLVPNLSPSDGIHDVGCKTVTASAVEAIKLLEIIDSGGEWKAHRQRGKGKLFLNRDFRPEHLRVIYETFDDDIVSHYLSGHLRAAAPRLLRQFE